MRLILLLWLTLLLLLRSRHHVWFVKGDSEALLTLDGEDLDVIVVKIGGSSLTHKAEKESIDWDILNWFSRTLQSAISEFFLATGGKDQRECIASLDDKHACVSNNTKKHTFVVVHGAGSFGHHTAKEYGLRGQFEPPSLNSVNSSHLMGNRHHAMKGLAETRLSVQKLNRMVVSNLVEHGINAVAVSPCFSVPNLQAHGGSNNKETTFQVHLGLNAVVKDSLQAGLVPVLHGDACLYGRQNAGILSGDILTEIIGKDRWVKHVIFLTDVDGVFTRDPRTDVNAELLRNIEVDPDSLDISQVLDASGSSHDHDVTGGLKTKLSSAAAIAASGRNVTIVKCGSLSAEQAMFRLDAIEKATFLYSREKE